jgi:hypothetical protein
MRSKPELAISETEEMTESTRQLRSDIATAASQLESLKNRLAGIERSCQHSWDKPKYIPICYPAYQTQGDPPGTMGVDWQGPVDVPASTTRQWSRTCVHCGKSEITQRTKKEWMPGTVAGTGGQVEVPDFGDRGYSSNGPSEGSYHWSDKPDCGQNRW